MAEGCPTYGRIQSNRKGIKLVYCRGENSSACSVFTTISVSSTSSNLWVTPIPYPNPSLTSQPGDGVGEEEGVAGRQAAKSGLERRACGVWRWAGSRKAATRQAKAVVRKEALEKEWAAMTKQLKREVESGKERI